MNDNATNQAMAGQIELATAHPVRLGGESPDEQQNESRPRQAVDRVWLRLSTAAELVDLTPAALRKRLARHPPRKGILKRWGGSIFVHQERFLRWLDAG